MPLLLDAALACLVFVGSVLLLTVGVALIKELASDKKEVPHEHSDACHEEKEESKENVK